MGTRGAVAACVRADARRSWPSWVVLGLVVGLAAGAVLAAAAGARRTDSAYERLVDETNAFTAGITLSCEPGVDGCPADPQAAIDEVKSWPGVVDAGGLVLTSAPVLAEDGTLVQLNEDPCDSSSGALLVVSPLDERVFRDVHQIRLLEGRLPDPTRADEAVMPPLIARQHGVEVGDTLRVVAGEGADCQDENTWTGALEVKVVGIGFTAVEVPPKSSGFYLQLLHTTPAFARSVSAGEFAGGQGGLELGVVLDDGATIEEVAAAEGVPPFEVGFLASELSEGVEDGIAADANALWLLALLASVASLCVIGPVVARQRAASAAVDRQLSALGWARRERVLRSTAHAAAVWAVAMVAALAVMLIVSTQTPIGDARSIDPHAGAEVDIAVVAIGAAALALVIATLMVLPAIWPGTRRVLHRRTPLAEVAANIGLRPPTVMGIRVGLEADRRDVPTRSALLAVALGGAAVVGVLVYTASVQDLREDPERLGVVWDDFVYLGDRPDGRAMAERARSWPEVEATGYVVFFTPALELGPSSGLTRFMAFGGAADDIKPKVISGRAPEGDDELILNPLQAEALGLDEGDRVDATLEQFEDQSLELPPEFPRRRFEVVGTGVVPLGDGAFEIGAAMTVAGYTSLLPPELADQYGNAADFVMIDRRDGVTAQQIVDRFAGEGVPYEPEEIVQDVYNDNIISIDRTGTESVPDLLGLLMAITGASVLVYGLVTTISRNRRDLAVARAIGFDRRLLAQTARATGGVQALAALVIAVPAGIIAGRAMWDLYSSSLGVVPGSSVPVLELVAFGLAAVALAVVAASLAMRWTGRHHPGETLRATD